MTGLPTPQPWLYMRYLA